MKSLSLILSLVVMIMVTSCSGNGKKDKTDSKEVRVLFLHHSTGWNVWLGGANRQMNRLTGNSDVRNYIKDYNREHKTKYSITEQYFPKTSPYGWKNYPYDYYNIWVKNAGETPYMEEPTLEMLTRDYDVIIFKHCFPVSMIMEDTGNPDINSEDKRLENYRLQYDALKSKMHEFPETKFIVWTPAVCVEGQITEDQARRTAEFYNWVTGVWDETDDNIYLWDFYRLETEGGIYMASKNAVSTGDSHPNAAFSASVAPLFGQYIIDTIEGK